SGGVAGNVGRNRKWNIAGFQGVFGINPDPISGGADTSSWIDLRRVARQRSKEEHALISSSDIVNAALAIQLLEVARAWVVEPDEKAPRNGIVRLIALRSRPDGKEPEEAPETRQWLKAIQRALVTRIPLGTRLVVAAPRYRDFSIHASVETESGRDPAAIQTKIAEELQKRLALVASVPGITPRQPGVSVTRRDVAAWIRAIGGVKRILHFELRDDKGVGVREIKVLR